VTRNDAGSLRYRSEGAIVAPATSVTERGYGTRLQWAGRMIQSAERAAASAQRSERASRASARANAAVSLELR